MERLRGWLPPNPILPSRPVFVLDGTTLRLPHTPHLVKAYPPSHKQHGPSHWPIIRLPVLQDVQTGLALRPHRGPQHGPNAVSEQELALQSIPYLPAKSVVLGDRNFGVLAVAWAADRNGHSPLVRLTRQRAEALAGGLAGGPLTVPSEQLVCWRPTRFDRVGGPFPDDACVSGRLVCLAADDPSHEELIYFFAALDLAVRLCALCTGCAGTWKPICVPSSKPSVCHSSRLVRSLSWKKNSFSHWRPTTSCGP